MSVAKIVKKVCEFSMSQSAWAGAATCGNACIATAILAADRLALDIAGKWFRCYELIESSLCSVQYALLDILG